jgi:hypothetical protein
MQLWFLSVLLNVFSGLVLIFSPRTNGESDADDESAAPAFFQHKTFRLVLGILCVLIGIIKFFVPIPLGGALSGIPVIGDLLPALAGIAGGGALLVDYYKNFSSLGIEFPAIVQKICLDNRKYAGLVCIIIAVLHFVFPRFYFL